MGDRNYLYINTVDILEPKKLIGLTMLFDFRSYPQVRKADHLDGFYYEVHTLRNGVELDEELSEFWSKLLAKKEIRSFYQAKPFRERKRKSVRLANLVD